MKELSNICNIKIKVIKSPVISINPVNDEIIINNNDLYISSLIRKGQQILDIDVWLPYKDGDWFVECSPGIYHLEQVTSKRFVLNLLINLNKVKANSSSVIRCVDTRNPLTNREYTINTFVIPHSRYLIT